MSLLSDQDLRRALRLGDRPVEVGQPGFDPDWQMPPGGLAISDLHADAIQPASIDLRLGAQFRYWPHPSTVEAGQRIVDPLDVQPFSSSAYGPRMLTATLNKMGDTIDVAPGQFILAHTHEWVTVGACLAMQVYGKSSIGRLGLEVENAGYVDPGFSGQITLELKNSTQYTIRLTYGMPICQIVAHRLSSPAYQPYGDNGRYSRYQGQFGATPSRYGLDREPIGKD